MTNIKYTIMHIPSGTLWNDVLVFDKKSQGVAWLNSLPVTHNGLFDPPTESMFGLKYPHIGKPKREWKRLSKVVLDNKLSTLGKFFILEAGLYPNTSNKFSLEHKKSILNTIARAEFEVVPVKASQTFTLPPPVKKEPE